MFEKRLQYYKAEHNQYWSKRLIFEQAGWPGDMDKGFLRKAIQAWEDGLGDAMRIGKASAVVGHVSREDDWQVWWEAEQEAELSAERGYYLKMAEEYGL